MRRIWNGRSEMDRRGEIWRRRRGGRERKRSERMETEGKEKNIWMGVR